VRSFQEWIERRGGAESMLYYSLYGSTINAYLRWFSPDALFVTSAECLSIDFGQTLKSVYDFLGLDLISSSYAEIKANADPKCYGRFAKFASSNALNIFPPRVQRRLRYGLRSQWFQKPLRYPPSALSSTLVDAIYSRVLDDCARSAVDISSLTRLWARH